MNEMNLWDAVRKDDIKAFNTIFDQYWPGLYKTAYRYTRDHECSEEIVNDVFLNIWNRRHQLDIRSLQSFLLMAVRYQVYNRMRSAKVPEVAVVDCSAVDRRYIINEGETRIQQMELEKELGFYLSNLPKRCQEIFRLSRIECFTNDEIAGRLGISKRTVENQLTIALKYLRESFKERASENN